MVDDVSVVTAEVVSVISTGGRRGYIERPIGRLCARTRGGVRRGGDFREVFRARRVHQPGAASVPDSSMIGCRFRRRRVNPIHSPLMPDLYMFLS